MDKLLVAKQLLAGFAATLSVGCAGFHFGWSSPSLPKLLAADSDIPITSDESSWIVSFFTFGCVFGPFIGVVMVNRCGRKYSLLLSAAPYLISCILLGVARSYWWFLVARFMAGVGSGISYTVAPMYLGEIADDRIRGALGSMIGVMLNTGILLTYAVGPWIGRVALAGFGAAFPILFGILFICMPESPHYLVMKDKLDSAQKSLTWLKGSGQVDDELKKIRDNVEFEQKNTGTVRELVMVPGNRKALIIVLGLVLAQQFSGIGAVLAYSSLIFEASGSTLDSSISVIIIGFVQVVSGLLTIFTVDLAGRRILLLVSSAGSILFLGGEALYFQLQAVGVDVTGISWLPVTCIVGYIIAYAIGLGSLQYVVLSEIFPYNVKALATMASAVAGALSGMVVAKLYQVVADEFGIHVSFWGFAVLTVFSMIFIYLILPETKQRSLRSIQDELHKTDCKSMATLEKSEAV